MKRDLLLLDYGPFYLGHRRLSDGVIVWQIIKDDSVLFESLELQKAFDFIKK